MNNNTYPWYLTWPAIIIAFIIFWPAAIVLIYLRSKNSKGSMFAAASNKKIYIILGVVLILLGLSRIDNSVGFGIFAIIGGIAIIYYANSLAKKATRNKSYIDLIVNQGETSIDKISSVLNVKYDVAVNELKTMQTLGILKGATINEQTHSISVQKMQNTANQISNVTNTITDAILGATSTNAANTNATPVQASCPGCGAKYTGAKGTTVTCDYCDATFVIQ